MCDRSGVCWGASRGGWTTEVPESSSNSGGSAADVFGFTHSGAEYANAFESRHAVFTAEVPVRDCAIGDPNLRFACPVRDNWLQRNQLKR